MVNVEFSNMYSYVDPMDFVVAGNIFVPAERPKISGGGMRTASYILHHHHSPKT
jgi:hypothetical protein